MEPRRHSILLRNEPESREKHEIVFYDWGNDSAVHTAICVHGLTRNAHDFDLLAEALAAKGRRVLCINVAGRGESAWLADPMLYNYGTYVADCLAVMDNFHLRGVEWIGTSMGGIIGMTIAAQKPDRIKKLVLNDIGSHLSAAALTRIYDYVKTMPMRFASRSAAETYLAKAFQPFGITDPDQWAKFVDASLLTSADGSLRYACDPAIAEPLRVATKDYTDIQEVNLTEIWNQVRIPTLIVHGADSDVLSLSTIHAMRATHLKTQVTTVSNVGHAPPLMNEDQIGRVIGWLTGSIAKPMAFGI